MGDQSPTSNLSQRKGTYLQGNRNVDSDQGRDTYVDALSRLSKYSEAGLGEKEKGNIDIGEEVEKRMDTH